MQTALQASSLGVNIVEYFAWLSDDLCSTIYHAKSHKSPETNNVQDEATALKVPIRFLHQLRSLLAQPETDPTEKSASELVSLEPFADVPEPAASADISTESSSEDAAVTSEDETDLQTALLAAPQALASIQGSFCEAVATTSVLQCMNTCT